MSKPVARGSVLVHLAYEEVDRDFARDVGEQGEDGGTVIWRVAAGRYATESRAGLARVLGEFELERADIDETVWVRPSFFGAMARVVLGRRRLQRGVDAALVRMARKATGDDQMEFGPEDFADAEGHFQTDAPPD
jgi:hypothetical protein